MKRFFFVTLLLLSLPLGSYAAISTRPMSGNGLLLVHNFHGDAKAQPLQLTFYREPGVGRLLELDAAELPSLSKVLTTGAGEHPLLVTGSRGGWLRIAYDEAGREGWIKPERYWDYQPWRTLLKGKPVHLMAGLKKGYYQLYTAPVTKSSRLETLTKQRQLRVVEIEGDWALVIVDLASSGWLRWRDDDGRFLISIDERLHLENR
jgi:hypothetical protein